MDPQSPITASQKMDAGARPRGPSRMHALQVRAFIEAAEVVDADSETIEDILDGYNGDVRVQDHEDDEPENADGPELDADEAGQGETDAPEDLVEEEYEALLEEAETVWSPEEVKRMKTDLKEKGKIPAQCVTYFINRYVVSEGTPVPKLLYVFGVCLCQELRLKCHKTQLYFLQVAMYHELQRREKLAIYNTVNDAVHLIQRSQRIIILTGAGISVSCGIPDFRSRTGIYAMLQEKGEYELDDPQQMFDIDYFKENPSVFYSFASQIYPSNFIPSPCHQFIKLIEDKGKLLRNYTQNIDTLETRAGVQKVLQCHGSFATASCINCRVRVPGNAIESEIMNRAIPLCKSCNTAPIIKRKKKGKKKRNLPPWDSGGEEEPELPAFPSGIMKPDITFFGEKLTDDFDKALVEDRPLVDLLIVIGTSLKVSPVSEIITHLRHSVPQILINKTPVKHINPDIVLLGNADEIVQHLCHKLQWDLPETPHPSGSDVLEAGRPNLRKRPSAMFEQEPRRVGHSHVWLFEGAEGGKWVEEMETRSLSPLSSPPSSESGAEYVQEEKPQFKRPRIQ